VGWCHVPDVQLPPQHFQVQERWISILPAAILNSIPEKLEKRKECYFTKEGITSTNVVAF
jgi:hypothetical protein